MLGSGRVPHIAHLTTAHARDDIRIFRKQCCTLANAGYKVTLVVADGKGNAEIDGVSIHDVGKSASRLRRRVGATRRVYQAAKKLDAELFHFHDPELLPIGLLLKKLGRKVIFDAHEDVTKQIMGRPWLSKYTRIILSKTYSTLEAQASPRFDHVICVTPSIAETFAKYGTQATIVANYPILNELTVADDELGNKSNSVCFVGGLTQVRGIREIVLAAAQTKNKVRLQVGGAFALAQDEAEIRALPEAHHTDFLGQINRQEVAQLMAKTFAGLVTFLPSPNHIDALPNKLFEYMSAGLPVIASDFPLWRDIINQADCGICVNPNDIQAIADAIDMLAANPERAKEMGRNGQLAVQQQYNWDKAAENLLGIYERLIGPPTP